MPLNDSNPTSDSEFNDMFDLQPVDTGKSNQPDISTSLESDNSLKLEPISNPEQAAPSYIVDPSYRGVKVNNPDGTFSTERTTTVGIDNSYFNIPTLINGVQYSPEGATKLFEQGKIPAVGKFANESDALNSAVARSYMLGKLYANVQPGKKAPTIPDVLKSSHEPVTVESSPFEIRHAYEQGRISKDEALGLLHAKIEKSPEPSILGDIVKALGDVGGVAAVMAAGFVRGATVGAVNPLEGTLGIPGTSKKYKYGEPLAKKLQESGYELNLPYFDVNAAIIGAEISGSTAFWSTVSKGVGAGLGAVKAAQTGTELAEPIIQRAEPITSGALGRIGQETLTGATVGAIEVRDKDQSFLKNVVSTALVGAAFQTVGEAINALAKFTGIGKYNAYAKLRDDLSDIFFKRRKSPDVTRAAAERAANIVIKAKMVQEGLEEPTAAQFRYARKTLKAAGGRVRETPVNTPETPTEPDTLAVVPRETPPGEPSTPSSTIPPSTPPGGNTHLDILLNQYQKGLISEDALRKTIQDVAPSSNIHAYIQGIKNQRTTVPEQAKGEVSIKEADQIAKTTQPETATSIDVKKIAPDVPEIKDTNDAVKFAKTATPEQLDQVGKLQTAYEQASKQALTSGQPEQAMDLSFKSQFMREVLESKNKQGGFAEKPSVSTTSTTPPIPAADVIKHYSPITGLTELQGSPLPSKENPYSRTDVGKRKEQSTKEYPYVPLNYFYGSGVSPKTSVFSGAKSVYEHKFKPGEIYPGDKDPEHFAEKSMQAVEQVSGRKPHIMNVFSKMVKDAGYKGFSYAAGRNLKEHWYALFGKVPVKERAIQPEEGSGKTALQVRRVPKALTEQQGRIERKLREKKISPEKGQKELKRVKREISGVKRDIKNINRIRDALAKGHIQEGSPEYKSALKKYGNYIEDGIPKNPVISTKKITVQHPSDRELAILKSFKPIPKISEEAIKAAHNTVMSSLRDMGISQDILDKLDTRYTQFIDISQLPDAKNAIDNHLRSKRGIKVESYQNILAATTFMRDQHILMRFALGLQDLNTLSGTAFHEGWHVIEELGLIDPNDLNRIKEFYPNSEDRAEAAREYMKNSRSAKAMKQPNRLRRIFEAIKRFLMKLSDKLRGIKQPESYDDIMTRTIQKLQRDTDRALSTIAKDSRETLLQIEAYHGSSYTFDKFTTSAIGTGEGAQAFGWGLYFSDEKDIAKFFANATAIDKINPLTLMKKADATLADTLQKVSDILYGHNYETLSPLQQKVVIRTAVNDMGAVLPNGQRNIYKVSLHKGKSPSQYTWLDWNEPISDALAQKINDNLYVETFGDKETKRITSKGEIVRGRGNLINKFKAQMWNQSERLTGGQLYSYLVDKFQYLRKQRRLTEINRRLSDLAKRIDMYRVGSNWNKIKPEGKKYRDEYHKLLEERSNINVNPKKEASLFLLNLGIDGIRYPAGTLSGIKSKATNYVVFDENAISIISHTLFQTQTSPGARSSLDQIQKLQYDLTINTGGSTVSQFGINMTGKPYIALSILKTLETVIKDRPITIDDIRAFWNNNKAILEANPDLTVGTRIDRDTDETMIDVSLTLPANLLSHLVTLGRKFGQRALYDLETGKEIRIDNPAKTVPSDEAQLRAIAKLTQLIAEGKKPSEIIVTGKPILTTAKQDALDNTRRLLGLDGIDGQEKRTWADALTQAKENKYNDMALDIAANVLIDPRPLSDRETAGLVIATAKIINEYDQAFQQVTRETDSAIIAALKTKIDRLEDQYDTLSSALHLSGSEKGRALAAQKLTINQNYDLVAVLSRAKAAKGSQLTTDERAKFEQLTGDLKKAQNNVTKLQDRIERIQTRKTINGASRSGLSRYKDMSIAQKDKILKQKVSEYQSTPTAETLADIAFNIGSRPGVKFIDTIAQRLQQYLPGIQRGDIVQAVTSVARNKRSGTQSILNNLTSIRNEARSDKALRSKISDLEKTLKSGDVLTPQPKIRRQVSDVITELRNYRDRLKKKISQSEATRKMRLQNTIKNLEQRLATGDIIPESKIALPTSKELQDLEYKRDKLRQDIRREIQALQPRTLRDKIVEPFNAIRTLITSLDLSAVLRQGGIIAFSRPATTAKSIVPMLKAFASENRAYRVNAEIESRPNAPLYRKAKLFIAPLDKTAKLSQREEMFMSRWVEKIPLIRASERAYVTFLNKLRADTFDALVDTLAINGEPNIEEANAIANYVNTATGRGSLQSLERSSVLLNTIFFAPRYVISRFQYLLGQPLYRGTAATRKLLAKEYAKYLIGVSIVLGLGVAVGGTVETDPRSPDFLKIKFGNTRLDPLAGLSQSIVLLTRLFSGSTKSSISGRVTSIRGKDVPYGGSTVPDVASRFLRSKLSPMVGIPFNIIAGENVVGQPVTPGSLVVNSLIPMSMQDIYGAVTDQGISKGTALSILGIFGMSLQTYGGKKNKKGHKSTSKSSKKKY